jgi:hypothetical protein
MSETSAVNRVQVVRSVLSSSISPPAHDRLQAATVSFYLVAALAVRFISRHYISLSFLLLDGNGVRYPPLYLRLFLLF